MSSQTGVDIETERVTLSACPSEGCKARCGQRGKFYAKHGDYRTRWNGRWVPRYRCGRCGRTFSPQTFRPSYRQHRPDVNAMVLKLYVSGVTQRRMARILAVDRKTVVRKFLFLAELAKTAHAAWLEAQSGQRLVQFDEMETFEHTKLKPVSIALAVHARTGAIISTAVEPMGYKGRLAAIAFAKYGPRVDRSGLAVTRVLSDVAKVSVAEVVVLSDDAPKYPTRVRRILPHAVHRPAKRVPPVLAQRRRNLDDPLYALNVTAAKLRGDLSRLARRTWVTTKRLARLEAHLQLYVAWNNGYRLAA